MGMRVLDVGCGTGDVSLLAAEFVGASGSVLGLDREAAPLEIARRRTRESNLRNVMFAQGDLSGSLGELGLFDAIVGRRVLMYQANIIDTVRKLASSLRPGGLFVFQEHDTTMVPASRPAMPLHFKVQDWIKETIKREGADLHMGFNLNGVLSQAGLLVEHVRAEAIVQTPTQKYPVASITRAILPRIVKYGVATEVEVDIDTLDERLDRERLNMNATYVGDMMFGVWARKPA
jgi:ubiquinone/menaquinone biosynthesis C-methylase UbiE